LAKRSLSTLIILIPELVPMCSAPAARTAETTETVDTDDVYEDDDLF
jgi:hypothetical protein